MLTQFEHIFYLLRRLLTVNRDLDLIKINQGVLLSKINTSKQYPQLSDYEFKVFSQWGEDGIIQHLIHNVQIKNKTFIELGVEDFFESNCRFLLQKDHWSGFVIDGSSRNINRLKRSYFYWKYPLNAICSFITQENIEELLSSSGFDRDIGILSVDIDGVDYYVLQKLSSWKPSILIAEYNALLGMNRAVSVPYSPSFVRSKMHYSNLYYGASLQAFVHIANNMHMALVGVNSAGSNAFFVRRELLNESLREVSVGECFGKSKFREARDSSGTLNCISGMDKANPILQLPVIDVISQKILKIEDLND